MHKAEICVKQSLETEGRRRKTRSVHFNADGLEQLTAMQDIEQNSREINIKTPRERFLTAITPEQMARPRLLEKSRTRREPSTTPSP